MTDDIPTTTEPDPVPVNTHMITNPASGFSWPFPSKAAAQKFARDAGLDVDVEEIQ